MDKEKLIKAVKEKIEVHKKLESKTKSMIHSYELVGMEKILKLIENSI